MTINSLRQQAVLLMKANKDGTYKERKRRAFVLEKILNELYALKQTPASWQDLETQHIHSVVKRAPYSVCMFFFIMWHTTPLFINFECWHYMDSLPFVSNK